MNSTNEENKGDFVEHMTPVTYMAAPLQKQFFKNKEALLDKPYADVFTPDLAVPLERARILQRGPLAPELQMAPTAENINRYITDNSKFPDVGYALVDGSLAYVQSRMVMPNVTAEMMRWWFLWHPLEPQRYSLWFPHSHVDTRVIDPARLSDISLSFEERLYGNTNITTEYIGPAMFPIHIHFDDPVNLGLSKETIDQSNLTFSVSGTLCPALATDTTFGLMMHLGRDTEDGFEFFSQYWIGAHEEMNRFKGGKDGNALLKKMGLGGEQLEATAYELSVHDMTEYHHLAIILPELYKRFNQ
jgi:hypothetical protein